MTLFLFPFAGGNKYSYRQLCMHLPDSIKVECLDLPGKGSRINEPLLTAAHEMCLDLFDAVKNKISGPYIFFGHSMGSLLAYLVAQHIRKENIQLPVHLIVSSFGAPSTLSESNQNLHRLPRSLFIEKVKAYSKSMQLNYHSDILFQLFEPILRADFQAVETYSYRPSEPFQVPLTVISATNDIIKKDVLQPWACETLCQTNLIEIDGGHFHVIESPQLSAGIVRSIIDELKSFG